MSHLLKGQMPVQRSKTRNRLTRSRFSKTTLLVVIVLTFSATSAFAQRGNQALMFGKRIASNGSSFAIAQVNPEPTALFVFSSARNSVKFVTRLPAPSAELSRRFGDALTMNSSSLIVGNPRANSGKGGVMVYPISRTGRMNLKGVKQLQPDLAYPFGQFGGKLAATDDLIAVAAPNASPPGEASGVVFLFGKQGADFKLLQKLSAGGPAGEIAQFGGSLAMDNQLLAVGVPNAPNNRRGEVRIFPRNGNTYAAQPTLVLADSMAPDSSYGWLVKMSPDWLIVGALEKSSNGEGAVYAYRRNRDGSIDQASKVDVRIPAGAAKPNDTIGGAFALIDSTLFVSIVTPSTSGSVLVFDLSKASAGSAAPVVQTLQPPTRAQPDQFGEAMAVLGKSILIGSPPPIASQPLLGATYLFSPDRKGVYSIKAKIDPQNGVKVAK